MHFGLAFFVDQYGLKRIIKNDWYKKIKSFRRED